MFTYQMLSKLLEGKPTEGYSFARSPISLVKLQEAMCN
jgi:hypothetical protein